MESLLPKVTVITVVYNLIKAGRIESFKQCLDSVQRQTYPFIEHIIIDGASTDGSIALFDDWGLTYYSEPDKGIYDAMNKGIHRATGEYIAILNSDDFYHNDKGIEDSVHALMKSEADFGYSPMVLEGHPVYKEFIPWINSIFTHMPFGHSSLIIRKKIMFKEGLYDDTYRLCADYDFIVRLVLSGYKGEEIKTSFVTFRCSGISEQEEQKELLEKECARVFFKNYRQFDSDLTFEDCLLIQKTRILPTIVIQALKKYSSIDIYQPLQTIEEKLVSKSYCLGIIRLEEQRLGESRKTLVYILEKCVFSFRRK